ncbi:MAG TPA: hypothetical protein VED40_18715 [Azospirillaceae bacterium]|nr:hypothetical protein [Azospirillaceae bacterium]
MPTEIRHIIFANDEIIRAVVEYHKRTANPLPAGSVVRSAPEKYEDQIRLVLQIDIDSGMRQTLIIEEATFAAALIFFCMQNKIPLPATAAKSLQFVGEQVALRVTKESGRKDRR